MYSHRWALLMPFFRLMVFVVASVTALSSAVPVFAQTSTLQNYSRAWVTDILDERHFEIEGSSFYTQRVRVMRRDTKERIELEVGNEYQPLNENQRLKVGKGVLLADQIGADGSLEYVIADVDRAPVLLWLFVGFLVLVVAVAKWQGLLSIVGMGISLIVLAMGIVPAILDGSDPIMTTLMGAMLIATITMYLSHGFKTSSHLSLASMMLTLLAVAVLSWVAVHTAQLVGLGSEEAYFLQFGTTSRLNLQGLLLGGIMLGALGILDDICVAQISTVAQLHDANHKLTFSELYQRGLAVGKDHVASLVNTLVLAYAGANLPLFLLFTINTAVPWWVTLNNEILAEEIVRTLVGSMGLVIAVPLSTLLAAWAFHGKQVRVSTTGEHHHH